MEEESAEKSTQGEQEDHPTLAYLKVDGVPGEAMRILKAGENTIGKSVNMHFSQSACMARGDVLAFDREATRSSILHVGNLCFSPGLGCSMQTPH